MYCHCVCGLCNQEVTGLLEDIPNPCTGVEASTAEPETVVTEQNGLQGVPQTVTQDSANPSTPVSDVGPLQLKEANRRSERVTAIKLSDYPGQEPSVCLLWEQ